MKFVFLHIKNDLREIGGLLFLLMMITAFLFYYLASLVRVYLEINNAEAFSSLFGIQIAIIIIFIILYFFAYKSYNKKVRKRVLIYRITGAKGGRIFLATFFEMLLIALVGILLGYLLDCLTYFIVLDMNGIHISYIEGKYNSLRIMYLTWPGFLLTSAFTFAVPVLGFMLAVPSYFTNINPRKALR